MAEEKTQKLDVTQVRQEVISVLSDPYSIPPEFKTWLYQTMGRGDFPIPYLAVQGLLHAGPHAALSTTVSQGVGDGTWSKLLFDTIDWDIPGGMADLTDDEIEVSSTGLWGVQGSVAWAAGAGNRRAAGFAIDGQTSPNEYRRQNILKPTTVDSMENDFFLIDRLSRGQKITLLCFQSSAASLSATSAHLRACYLGNIIT